MKKASIRSLTAEAKAKVVERGEVNYNMLCEVLKTTNKGVITKVMKSLKRQGIIAQNKSRRWQVLVKPDGTKLEAPVAPKKRKIRRKRGASTVTHAAQTVAAAPARKPARNGGYSQAVKLGKLRQIIGASGPDSETSKILEAIVADVETAGAASKVLEALK